MGKKIADVNLAIHPDLILIDARKAMVTGGPAKGKIVCPNLILATGDIVAADIEGLKILLSYNEKNHLKFKNPYSYEQIKQAAKKGLGVKSEKEIKVINIAAE